MAFNYKKVKPEQFARQCQLTCKNYTPGTRRHPFSKASWVKIASAASEAKQTIHAQPSG